MQGFLTAEQWRREAADLTRQTDLALRAAAGLGDELRAEQAAAANAAERQAALASLAALARAEAAIADARDLALASLERSASAAAFFEETFGAGLALTGIADAEAKLAALETHLAEAQRALRITQAARQAWSEAIGHVLAIRAPGSEAAGAGAPLKPHQVH